MTEKRNEDYELKFRKYLDIFLFGVLCPFYAIYTLITIPLIYIIFVFSNKSFEEVCNIIYKPVIKFLK